MRFRFIASTVAVGVLAFLSTLMSPVATATPATTQACTTDIRSADYVTFQGVNANEGIGAVQLRKDDCGNYWAYVLIYGGALTSNEFAQAWVSRWENGVRKAIYSCDSPGGNGRVVAGQTWCVTPKIESATASSLFIASAHYYYRFSSSSAWIDEYWGQTPALR